MPGTLLRHAVQLVLSASLSAVLAATLVFLLGTTQTSAAANRDERAVTDAHRQDPPGPRAGKPPVVGQHPVPQRRR